MIRAFAAALVLAATFHAGAQAQASRGRPGKADPAADTDGYARDQITVSTEGRGRAHDPTATCLVWANAEGLGVGPAQLGGLHGLSLTLVVRPVGEESPKSFAQGLAEAKAAYPNAPEWLLRTLTSNQAAIETACGEDHPDPVTVHRITRADMR